jgi:hypothetical protein
MHGFALDAEGRKMSKSFGNVVTPEEVVNQFGVDVLRFYVLWANAPWDDLKFNWDGVKTIHRTLNILWNVYRFPLPYMILDCVPSRQPQVTASRWDDSFVRAHIKRDARGGPLDRLPGELPRPDHRRGHAGVPPPPGDAGARRLHPRGPLPLVRPARPAPDVARRGLAGEAVRLRDRPTTSCAA